MGNFEVAINPARQIGDDRLQRNAGRVPMPDSFTQRTLAQWSKWLQIGLKSGKLSACNTFKVDNPGTSRPGWLTTQHKAAKSLSSARVVEW